MNHNYMEDIINWASTLSENFEDIITNTNLFMNNYLGFIFKRKNILEMIMNSATTKDFKTQLNASWDGREKPIYRPYPTVELKDGTFNLAKKKKYLKIIQLINNTSFIYE